MSHDTYIRPEIAALADKLHIHPRLHPLGDGHHTDEPLTPSDLELGNLLAYFMGTLQELCFAGGSEEEERERVWDFYMKSTSWSEWARIARALRIHGLTIVSSEQPKSL